MPANVLLVEGNEDLHVMKHICGNRGLPEIEEIRALDSVEQLLEALPVRLKAVAEGDIVGIVVDADTDLASRWKAVQTHLVRLGYRSVPESPDPAGTVIDPPQEALLPRFGAWIMPNNRAEGILENFLAFLVPPGSPLFQHACEAVAAIPAAQQKFSDLAKPKAIIHTWLAWQEKPGCPLGRAITARYLDPNLQEADSLVAWLKRLYRW